jgi:hypothetical protein
MYKLVTPNECLMLRKYASQAKLGIVEIGVLDGGTTRELISASNVPVYGIDPMVPDSNDPNLIGNESLINQIDKTRFMFFKDFSYNVAVWWNYPYDFLFIDGDHRSFAVKKDFEAWSEMSANKKLIIALHDTTVEKLRTGEDGPYKFVNDELLKNKKWTMIDSVDSLKVFENIL